MLSICIVSLNARDYLRACIHSIETHPPASPREIIVVDNGSTDGTREMLAAEFPQIQVIRNDENLGYTRPNNQAMRIAKGDILLLNPDTLVHPGAFDTLLRFLEQHPQVGICGPKILNRDGTLQKPCRRGVSRPWAVFSYFSGLATLFPKNPLFTGYLLTHLPEDEIAQVDGVSGACMLIRRAVYDQIGGFDERFFAYQEDADYCFQAQKAGWQVFYVPQAQVTHYGGMGGSRTQPYRSIIEWHRSYYLYYRKNLAHEYFFVFNWFYYSLMLFKLVLSLLTNSLRRTRYAGPRRG
ncbi:MAG: hypothetical protein OHK0052_01510 [Anaerolineales bacterium]